MFYHSWCKQHCYLSKPILFASIWKRRKSQNTFELGITKNQCCKGFNVVLLTLKNVVGLGNKTCFGYKMLFRWYQNVDFWKSNQSHEKDQSMYNLLYILLTYEELKHWYQIHFIKMISVFKITILSW